MAGDELRIRILGPLEVACNGRVVELPRSKKARVLLVYLALNRRAHARSRLCDLFWDVADDPRGGLRWCLSRLRKAINAPETEFLIADRNNIEINRDAVWVDVTDLRERLRGEEPCGVDELRELAALPGGEPLEGIDFHDMPAVQAWLVSVRSEARDLLKECLLRLLDELSTVPDQAVPFARQLLQLDPDRLESHVAVVELLARAGKLREAEEQYRMSIDEIEAQGGSSHALRVAWRRASAAPTDVGDAPAADEGRSVTSVGFVGRVEEMATLDQLLSRALSDRGGSVALAGEPGIGKSTLVGELRHHAEQRGVQVLRGACLSSSESLPYFPFIDALDAECARIGPAGLGAELALLARVMPSLADHRAAASSSESEADRYAVFRAVASLLHRIAGERGLVLVLEDLHWADTQSLLMLVHLARQLTRSRVLLVATYRDEELTRRAPLRDAIEMLRRDPNHTHLALERLDADAARKLIRGLADVDDDVVAAIEERTGGHPLFIRELLRHLGEEELLSTGGAALSAEKLDRAGLPAEIRAVVERRTARLSEECRRLLAVASAMSGVIPWLLLVEVCGGDEDELLDLLDEALAAQIIRERPEERTGSYEFHHALIRQALYEAQSTSRRVRLHKKIAAAIEVLHEGRLEPQYAELVYHYGHVAHAGNPEPFLDYSMRAGERAMSMMAYEEAAELFAGALTMLDELGAREEHRAELHGALGRALAMVNNWQDARAQYELVLGCLGDDAVAERTRTLLNLALSEFWLMDIARVHARASEAHELAVAAGDRVLTAAATGFLAQVDMSNGEQESGERRYREARALASVDSDPLLAQALQYNPIQLYWAGRFDETTSIGEPLMKIAKSYGDGSMVMNLLPILAMAHGCAGRYRASAALFAEAQRFGSDHGIETLTARARCMSVGGLIDLFAYERARERAEEAREAAASVGFLPSLVSAQLDLLRVHIRLGDLAAAGKLREQLVETVERASGFHGWVWAMRLKLYSADYLLAAGQRDQALGLAIQAEESARDNLRSKLAVEALLLQARAHLGGGRERERAACLTRAAEEVGALGYPALAIRVAAELAEPGSDHQLVAAARPLLSSLRDEIEDQAVRRAFDAAPVVTALEKQ